MQQQPVSDLMRDGSLTLIDESLTVREAAARLLRQMTSVLTVVRSDGTLAGQLTEASIVRSLLSGGDSDQTIAGCVTRHVESIRASADLLAVAPLFRSTGHEQIPVVNEAGVVLGLLHRHDVLEQLLPAENQDAATPELCEERCVRRPYFLAAGSPRPHVVST